MDKKAINWKYILIQSARTSFFYALSAVTIGLVGFQIKRGLTLFAGWLSGRGDIGKIAVTLIIIAIIGAIIGAYGGYLRQRDD